MNVGEAPTGSPETARATGLSKPPTGFTATLKLVFSPCFAEAELGDADMVKSAASLTASVAVLDAPPPEAVTVSV